MLPGANNASITRQTLMHGRRAGLLTVAGASAGILIWAGAAAIGLSAILLANPATYLAIRIGGAAVLFALGIQALWALRKRPRPSHAARQARAEPGPAAEASPSAWRPASATPRQAWLRCPSYRSS